MLPDIFVKDYETQKCELFLHDEDVIAFFELQNRNGVDIDSRYTVYKFNITDSIDPTKAIKLIIAGECLEGSEDEE
jgi:hypothetical protein